MRTRPRLLAAATLLAVAAITAACAPQTPSGSIETRDWKFGGTKVTVDKSQDRTCVILCFNEEDEPYLLTVNFRVKIGSEGSAQTFVVNDRTNAPEDVPVGGTRVAGQHFPPSAGGEAVFGGIKALDLLDLANENNKLEIVGSYVWASEEDQIGNGLAADSVASALKGALNSTIAKADLTSLDASFIINLILNNIGNAMGILVQNIPTLGLGDDVLGGGIYIGIGARGTLGSALNGVIGSTPFPTINTPVELPPSITGGGFYTISAPKTFTQTFSGRGGIHTWEMQSGPA